MKTRLLTIFFCLSSLSLYVQILSKTDTTATKSEVNQQLKEIKKEKIELHSGSIWFKCRCIVPGHR